MMRRIPISREESVMIRQIEEGDAKGGIVIPKDRFKEFVELQKRWGKFKKSEV